MKLEVVELEGRFSVRAQFRPQGAGQDDVTIHNIRYSTREEARNLVSKIKRMVWEDRRNGTSEMADYVSNRHYWTYVSSDDPALLGTSGQVINVGRINLPIAA